MMRACWLRGILILGPTVSFCGALLTKNFHAPPPRRAFHTTLQQQEQRNPSAMVDLSASRYSTIRMPLSFLRMADDGGEDGDRKDTKPERDNKKEEKLNLLNRFTSPIIDDPGLPLSDVLVAQVIAPSLQIAWLSLRHAPQPSWLKPIVDTDLLYSRQGTLVAPALIHGAALAFCWVVGALAARAYERRSISPVKAERRQDASTVGSSAQEVEWDYSNVIKAILQGGAFATGLLILSTQVDLFLEYGRWVQVGESEEIDFRLLVAIVELINDVVFEASTISAWRLFLAYQTERMAQ